MRAAALTVLLAIVQTSAPAEQAASERPSPNASVSLEVGAGTPLRLYLTKRVWFHRGDVVTARVIDPAWAFDRVVIPAGTLVQGTVSSLKKISGTARARAILGGDFTPLEQAELSFTKLEFADGRQMPITATPAFGQDTTYIPPRAGSNASRQPSPSTVKKKLKGQVRQAYESKRDSAIYFVRGQNKKEWIQEWLLGKLPYHPQLYRTRTRVDAELVHPLEFGQTTMGADASRGFGQLPPERASADVRLLTTLTSAEAHNGETVSGVLMKPMFASDHSLLLPVGTTFTGKVTLSQSARWFRRGGKLRFAFDRLDLPVIAGLAHLSDRPANQPIQAQLAAIESNPASVVVDSEGTAKTVEPKTRFIRPVIAGLVAARSADDDRDRSSSGGIGASNPNLSGRALGGFSGFGLLGNAASFGPRGIGAALGYYGFAWSVYSNLIARGKQLVFEKNTAMEIQFTPETRRH